MRFIHTADWHLGRLFNSVHLTDDQAIVLDAFCDIVRQTRPDAVVIAGDIYDRSVPPPEAVDLFNRILTRLAIELNTPVILIAGNHDSPQRLGFANQLLAHRAVHIFGPLTAPVGTVTLADADGPVHFHCLPYADPATVRACFDDSSARCHESAMKCCLDRIRADRPHGRHVLVAHAFVVGGAESESERPLSVGGAGTIPAEIFDGFDYVALGHLHGPQQLPGGKVRYSGSPMKYSFSEAAHVKGVVLVEIDGAGTCQCQTIPLKPPRDVRDIRGTLAGLLAAAPADGSDDYIRVFLEDDGPVFDAMGRLQAIYPTALAIERPNLLAAAAGRAPDAPAPSTAVDEMTIFEAFFKDMTDADLTADQRAELTGVIDTVRNAQREVIA